MRAAKFFVATVGSGLTAAQAILTPNTVAWNCVTVGLAVVTAAGVYYTTNAP